MKAYAELYTLVKNALQRDQELDNQVNTALRYLNIDLEERAPVPPAAAPLDGPLTIPLL
jgi:hypothetical protein